MAEASVPPGVNVGWWIVPSPAHSTVQCFSILVFLPFNFALLGSCAVHRGEGGQGGEWNRPGLCSRVAPKTGSPNPSPPVQVPLLPGAPAGTHFLPALFLLPAWSALSWPGPPGTGQVGQGCPSLITSPSPRGPCLCSRSLCFVCYPVCDSPPLLFKAAYFIHHRQQFIFPGESFAWFH